MRTSPAAKPAPHAGVNSPAQPAAAPAATRRRDPLVKGLITTLVGIALVPLAILFVLLWQDMMRPQSAHDAAGQTRAASLPGQSGSTQLKQAAGPLEVALSSPDRIAADVMGIALLQTL